MALAQSVRMPDAASELPEAVHLAPDRREYRVFQAHVFEQLRQTDAADRALAVFQDEQALRQLSPAWQMARYWFAEKQYAEARIYAQKVKTSRPDNSELQALLGDIYSRLGEKQNVAPEYQEALRLAPDRQHLREREGSRQ